MKRSEFGGPMFKPEFFRKQIYFLSLHWRKHLWHCWDFSEALQWFGVPIMIRRPGNCALLPTLFTPLTQWKRYSQKTNFEQTFLWSCNLIIENNGTQTTNNALALSKSVVA